MPEDIQAASGRQGRFDQPRQLNRLPLRMPPFFYQKPFFMFDLFCLII